MLLSLVLADILHYIKILIIGDIYLKLKCKNKKKIKIFQTIIIIMVASGLMHLTEDWLWGFLCYVLAIIISLIVIYDERKIKLAITGIWIIIVISLLDVMSRVMINTIFSIFNINNIGLNEISVSLLSLTIVYITGLLIKRKKGLSGIKNIYFVCFTVLEAVDMIVLMVLADFVINTVQLENKFTYSLVFILMIIGVFIQLIAVIRLMVSRNEHKEKEIIIKRYLNEQKAHYEYLEQREYETRKFRHDLKSHMHMLQNFSKNKDYEKFDKYLELINIKVDDFANRISVNNDIVDAIINKYYTEANKNNIKMKVEGHFPRQCNISAYDLCTIFSNLLNNALEAADKSDRKEINVSCRYNDEDIIIIISNYYSGEVKYVDGHLRTSKKNARIHGFGLENVEDCVENNGGYIKINNESNIFSVTILLKNLQEEAK